jgi:endonuclease/exonuclease/phosphatase family metal-dependent hydrolase
VGIGGSFLVRFVPLRRRALWLAALFGLFAVLRQLVPGESSSPVFAFAAWAVWLWWLPEFLRGSAGRRADLATGAVLGVALQVAGQIALHGLDLELISGPASVVAALLLAGAFVLLQRGEPVAVPAGGAWGAFALGPFLFLELTFLANLGRVEVQTGLPPLVVQLAVGLGLVAGLALHAIEVRREVRIALELVAVALLVPAASLAALGAVAVVLVQAGLALGLLGAFIDGPRHLDGRVHLGAAIGGLVFFAFLFVFYSYRDRTDFLWPVAAALVAAPSLLTPSTVVVRTWRPAIAAALAILSAIAIAAIPPAGAHPPANAGPDITVLQYNVHQGLDYWSVPSAAALVDRIESANADLVGLQEVNRGWDLSAGIDFFSYVRWRLPQYHAVYGRMDTALFGNAILSRYPITDSSYGTLPHLTSALNRGYVWANIAAPGGPVLFVATHFTAYEGFDVERAAQADAFVSFWAKRPRAILAGDYNAHPDEVTITKLIASGLVDAGAAAGIAKDFTYSSGAPYERIDYVFVSPDVTPVSARILEGTASDHRPVLVVVRLK